MIRTRAKYAAIAVFILFFSGCAGLDLVQEPTVRIVSVDIESLDFTGAMLSVGVEVNNPNPLGLSLSAYDYHVNAWSEQIVTGRKEDGFSLRPSGTTHIPVPVAVSFSDLTDAAAQALSAETVPIEIALGLEIAIPYWETLRFDVSGSIELPIPKPPLIEPVALNVGSLSLTGASIAMEWRVKNPNSIGMGIDTLAGRLLVDGSEWGVVGIDEGIELQPGASKTIKTSLKVDFSAVGMSVYRMLLGGGNAEVQLNGDMDVRMDMPGFSGGELPWDADAKVSILR